MVGQDAYDRFQTQPRLLGLFFIVSEAVFALFGVLQAHYARDSRHNRRRMRYRLVSAQVTNNRCAFFTNPL
jgi:hypothetical protein